MPPRYNRAPSGRAIHIQLKMSHWIQYSKLLELDSPGDGEISSDKVYQHIDFITCGTTAFFLCNLLFASPLGPLPRAVPSFSEAYPQLLWTELQPAENSLKDHSCDKNRRLQYPLNKTLETIPLNRSESQCVKKKHRLRGQNNLRHNNKTSKLLILSANLC